MRGALALARGDRAGAVGLVAEAAYRLEAADMAAHAAAARRRLGLLLGGADGQALTERADAWLTSRQVRNPARMTAVLAPGFPESL
jgi:hypothetical protein